MLSACHESTVFCVFSQNQLLVSQVTSTAAVFGSLICAPLFTSPFLLHLGILCSPPSISSLKAWLTRSFLFSCVFNCTSALKGVAFSLQLPLQGLVWSDLILNIF